MKKCGFLAIWLTCLSVFAANTWKVERLSGDDVAAAADDSGGTAFQSIQAAVDKAKSGDRILVGPGVYDNNMGVDSKKSRSRVWITGKTLTIESTDGAAKTHIVGQKDTSSASTNGCGAAQIRCVCVNSDSLNTVIRGFTLRDGATKLERTSSGQLNEDIPQLGGGLAVYSQKKEVYLVDCVISNCAACWGGAMRGGTAVRCLIARNKAYSQGHDGVRQAHLYSSVVIEHEGMGTAACPYAINCTFGGNESCVAEKVYNCLYMSGNKSCNSLANCVQESYSGPQMVAPMFGNYRLQAGSEACTAGSAAYLTGVIPLPEGCEGKDFYGNPFPVVGAATVAGAVGENVAVAHGGLYFADKVICNGEVQGPTYAFFNEWPKQICVRPYVAEGKTFFRYKVSGANTQAKARSRWLQKDGTLWLVPPYAAGVVMTNTAQFANQVIWADANYAGGDADGSFERPYSTLQEAVDCATNGLVTVINVKEGDYNRGETWASSRSNRVYVADGKYVLLRAVGAVEKTIIRGKAASLECQQEPVYYPGCGSNAVSCVNLATVNSASAVQGFTIADGHSNCANYRVDVLTDRCGGVEGASPSNYALTQVLDCVFTNCAAVRGGAFYSVWASRCKILDCHSFGGVTRYGVLSSSFVDRLNTAGDTPADRTPPGASPNNVVGTSTSSIHLTIDWKQGATNRGAENTCLLASTAQRLNFPGIPCYGSVARRIWSSGSTVGGVYVAPQFVDEDHGDFRPLSTSPSMAGGNFADDGTTQYAEAMNMYATFATTGLDNEPIRFTDGVPCAGAYQRPAAALVTVSSSGSLSVNGVTTATTNVMPKSVTVRVEKGDRPVTGFTVKGDAFAYDGSQSSWTISAADYPDDETIAIQPTFGTNWYVNATSGSDDADGFTPNTAKLTFHGAGGVMATVKDGDCVHAGPGVYDRGYSTRNGFLRRRLVVPAGVMVVADEGPESTVIMGEAATESGVDGYDVDAYGRGTNAVACVYVGSTDQKVSVVRGFTLTGGRTHIFADKGVSFGLWDYNAIGGAAVADQAYNWAYNARVEDCIVSNNAACRGGALISVHAIRCRIFDNVANNGGASANCFHQGCIVDDNFSNYGAVADPRNVWNCTIGGNNRTLAGTARIAGITSSYGKNGGVVNTLCLAAVDNITNANNSCFLKIPGLPTIDTNDVRMVNCKLLDSLPIAEDYSPVIDSNAAVDAADPALTASDWYGDVDVYGNPRAVNGGKMDIGAVETDWRARYARDLTSSRRFEVTAADPMVKETETRSVMIPNGATVMAKWTNGGVPCAFTVRLNGSGSLKVVNNGETYRTITAAGETSLRLDNGLAVNEIGFLYEGEGSAELLSSRRLAGAMLMLR